MGDESSGAEWSRYWSGRSGVDDAEVYTRPGIEADEELSGFWEGVISAHPKDVAFVDLACGAGSVVRHASRLGYSNLTGVDIAPDAIRLLEENFKGVTGVRASIEDLADHGQRYGLVVSQFGFEYAGTDPSAPIIANLVAPGGEFVALVHMTEGAIASECDAAKQSCEAFANTGFVPAAIKVFEAFDKVEKTGSEAAKADLSVANQALLAPRDAIAALANTGHQLAGHTLSGTQIMFQRRRFYKLDDILDWLIRVDEENKAHQARMQGMLDASLTEAEATALLSQLSAFGLETDPLRGLEQGDPKQPIAWIIRARKPA
ncbi:MAG: hypothetical protein CMK09_18040 [Ponticaulis sp.]|nr:hypothetical protein [Ponticaulis sp.]|tara:strand:- start:33921 stop:34874 length:954 start_codon:yes stop_codon:yes gene_type:complete